MALLTRSDVCFGVREQIVRAEGKEVEFADVSFVKVVPGGKPDEERLVAIFAHELVQLLADMIHYELL